MIIIDNFFENSINVRNYALSLNYYPYFDGKKGYRSEEYSIERNNIERLVIEKIKDQIKNSFQKTIIDYYICSHFSPECVMQSPGFHNYKFHTDDDRYDCAGIVYLTPNPPPNSGTCFVDGDCIENKYNRLIAYSSNIKHAPDHLFGCTKEDSRLTITFFLKFKSI